MMKTKNQLSDLIDNNFYYSDGVLYTVEPGLRLSKGSDSGKKKAMEKALNDFKAKNNYVVQNNRLYPRRVA